MEQHINISLRLSDKDLDIRIPTKIEIRKLIKEIDAIFGYNKKRKKYQLRVINKGILLDEGKILADYPITTGDLVEIEEII